MALIAQIALGVIIGGLTIALLVTSFNRTRGGRWSGASLISAAGKPSPSKFGDCASPFFGKQQPSAIEVSNYFWWARFARAVMIRVASTPSQNRMSIGWSVAVKFLEWALAELMCALPPEQEEAPREHRSYDHKIGVDGWPINARQPVYRNS
jgi:hypothetical protein